MSTEKLNEEIDKGVSLIFDSFVKDVEREFERVAAGAKPIDLYEATYNLAYAHGVRVGIMLGRQNIEGIDGAVDLASKIIDERREFGDLIEGLGMKARGLEERYGHPADCECVPCKLVKVTR